MESLPVVEVVQVYRIGDAAIVDDAGGCEDFLARGVVVLVADDGFVVFFDDGGIEGTSFGIENPLFAGRVAGLLASNEDEEGFAVDLEGIEGHLVVALASGWIVWV